MAVASRLNEDVTTAFPIAEAIPRLQPGVYVLAAYASAKKESDNGRSATQWFVVSDLGLTALNGDDGSRLRALAASASCRERQLAPISRTNDVLGTARPTASAVRFTRPEAGEAERRRPAVERRP